RYDFFNNYGGKLYRLFSLEDCAQKMKENYQAPIYGMEILFGVDENELSEEMSIFGSFHGVIVTLLHSSNKSYDVLFGYGYESKGADDLAMVFQDYLYQFINDDIGNNSQSVEWQEWQADSKENILFLDADKEKAIMKMGNKEYNYTDVLEEMEADTSLSSETKEELVKNVLNGRWFSYELDKEY